MESIIKSGYEIQEELLKPGKYLYNLITDRLQDTIALADLFEIIKNCNTPKVYWGTAPTGKPHLGYFVPLLKIVELLQAGCTVTILIADLHSLLDKNKTPPQLIEHRTNYYEKVIDSILTLLLLNYSRRESMLDNRLVSIGLNIKNESTFHKNQEIRKRLKFVRGSSFQKSPEYITDLYETISRVKLHTAQKAGSEVVKQQENPLLSSLVYPIMQSLDEKYLNADAELGGIDQCKIFGLSRDINIEGSSYKKITYLMNPILPGLQNNKMSSSGTSDKLASTFNKIEFTDDKATLKRKFKKAFSVDGKVENNPLLAIYKHIIFPFFNLKGQRILCINRKEKFGGDIYYKTYHDLEKDFTDLKLASLDLKLSAASHIDDILTELQVILNNTNLLDIEKLAYP